VEAAVGHHLQAAASAQVVVVVQVGTKQMLVAQHFQ
jgi:hypothetical protein